MYVNYFPKKLKIKNKIQFLFQYKSKTKIYIEYNFNTCLSLSFWSRTCLTYTLLAYFYAFIETYQNKIVCFCR